MSSLLPSRLRPPARLSAAALFAALCAAPAAFTPAVAQTTVIERLSFGPPMMNAAVPRVEVEGSSLTQGELTALFQFKDVRSIADMLSRFNARALRVPEIRMEQNLPAAGGRTTRQTTIYRDLVLTDISAGKARSAVVAGGAMEAEDDLLGKTTGSFGRMSVEDVDFTAIVRFLIDKASGGEAPRTLYRNGSLDGMSMKGAKFEMSLGRMSFGEFRARPLKEPVMSIVDLAQKMEANKGEKPSPEDTRRLVDFVMDILDAFESTPATLHSLRVVAPDKDRNQPVTVSMGKMTVGAFGKRRYPAIQMENLDIRLPTGGMSIASITFKGIDFNPTAAGLQEAGLQPLEQWAAENWRKLLPSFDGFAFAGFNIDVPDDKNPGQRIKARIGEYDLTLTSYLQGVPTNIATSLRNFIFEIPAGTKESGLRDLIALGFRTLDMSATLRTRWNEAERVIAVETLSAQGTGMGAVNIKANIGNAIRELFAGDPTMMQIAAMGLTAKDIEIKLDNSGLIEKLIAREAQKQGKKPEDLRRDLGAMANIMIPGMLGGGAAAQAVANAVSAFLAKPGSLTIAARSKDPVGVSVGEAAMAAGNPASLLQKVDLTARAN